MNAGSLAYTGAGGAGGFPFPAQRGPQGERAAPPLDGLRCGNRFSGSVEGAGRHNGAVPNLFRPGCRGLLDGLLPGRCFEKRYLASSAAAMYNAIEQGRQGRNHCRVYPHAGRRPPFECVVDKARAYGPCGQGNLPMLRCEILLASSNAWLFAAAELDGDKNALCAQQR